MLALVAAAAGFVFSAVSTSDFAAHLDRQVHGIHCSFLPGIGTADVSGTTGCHVTLMSPYSSALRDTVWGGIPISLPAMGVFAFLVFWCLYLLVRGHELDTRAAGFLCAATGLPLASSLVMGYLSLVELDAACKLCIGIYTASLLGFVGALGVLLAAHKASAIGGFSEPVSWLGLGLTFGLGVLFVLAPLATYARAAPDFSRFVGSCGTLDAPADPEGVLVALGSQGVGTPMVEVLDPLCPACRGFEARFTAMPIAAKLSRKALLFPLDDECNWMVDNAIHPGACAVSEAVLCAGDGAAEVLAWSFAEQHAIVAAARSDSGAAAAMVKARFPKLAVCVGSASVRARLNRGLRWAVKNQLQVLTPQVFVGGHRLCDEDTDLGLDWALPRLVEHAAAAPRKGGKR